MKASPLPASGLLPALLATFLCLSCTRMEPDIHRRRLDTFPHHAGQARGAVPARDSLPSGNPVTIPPEGLFVTAVAYPDGYDWRRDTAWGQVRCHLLLLRLREEAGGDGAPLTGRTALFDTLLCLEAGAGRAVSPDPDRHQFAGGHLHTQCHTEIGTVYRQDGRTVFLSPEREYVRGILPLEGDLYVLSQRLDRGGFVLRRNWKPVFEHDGGRLHGSLGEPGFGCGGALFADGDDVCFLYEDSPGTGGWILVRNAVQERVVLPDGITRLDDVRCFDGMICLACRWKQREPVLFAGGKKHDLSATLQVSAEKSGYRLLHSDAGLRISGAVRLRSNGQRYTALWSEKRLLAVKAGRCDWWDPEFFVRKENGRIAETGTDALSYPLDGGSLMMPACAYRSGSDLYLALSGPDAPILWHNGRAIPLPLNGFPTSVTLLY